MQPLLIGLAILIFVLSSLWTMEREKRRKLQRMLDHSIYIGHDRAQEVVEAYDSGDSEALGKLRDYLHHRLWHPS